MPKKESIRKAAVKIIADEGFFSATTDKIAKEAGFAVGTIYNYFSNKEDILKYILDVEYQKRYEFYQRVKDSQKDPLLKIKELLDFHFTEIQKEPEIIRIVLAEKGTASRSKLMPLEKYTKLSAIFSEIFIEGMEEDYFRRCDPKILAIAVFGFLEAVMSEFLITKDVHLLNRSTEELIGLLRTGLMK